MIFAGETIALRGVYNIAELEKFVGARSLAEPVVLLQMSRSTSGGNL
jgi:hypothetical protein